MPELTNRKVEVTRHFCGGGTKRVYRNYYCAAVGSPADLEWQGRAAAGLAERIGCCFHHVESVGDKAKKLAIVEHHERCMGGRDAK